MLESVLIRNVDMMLPEGLRTGDILIRHGRIEAIEPRLNVSAELELDDKGLTLLPGIIDAHVHFREPGAEWKEDLASGSRAAVAGGVTSFFDMPNTQPSATTIAAIEDKKMRAARSSLANYNFFIGATTENLNDLNQVENVPGIKIFVGSSTGSLLVDKNEDLTRIFESGDRLIAVHSEEEQMVRENRERCAGSTDVKDHYQRIRTWEAAIACTRRLVALASHHKRRLHICHLTTQEEAEFLAENPSRLVTTEVCPQHLLLAGPDIYDQLKNYAQINPPIRDERHRKALWKALLNGTIGMIATDHAPHTKEEKEKPFGKAPSGMPGVETALPLMLTQLQKGLFTLPDLVRWMCENPARYYGIENKGQLAVGYDADMVLVDLNANWTIRNDRTLSKCGWSAFDGWSVKGRPLATFVNGQMVFREGDFPGKVMGREIRIRQSKVR